MYNCQLCEVNEINAKAFEKLDEMADNDELIVCPNCFNGRSHEALFVVKAQTKTAYLVQITWLRSDR